MNALTQMQGVETFHLLFLAHAAAFSFRPKTALKAGLQTVQNPRKTAVRSTGFSRSSVANRSKCELLPMRDGPWTSASKWRMP